MARLTKQQIMGAKLTEKEVEVKSLGGSVLLQEMTMAQQEKVRESCTTGTNPETGLPIMDTTAFQRKMVMETCIDPVFEPCDFEGLLNVKGKAWIELRTAVFEINGLTRTLEDAEKN